MISTAAASAVALAAALMLAAAPAPALAAGQDSSAATAAGHLTAPQAAGFGKALERDLGARGARVALVFRSGRPRKSMPKGMGYTHGALWIYRDITTTDGKRLQGYAVYNLYSGDGKALAGNRSHLVQDWPTDFMIGSAEDDVAVILPTPEMQRRLLTLVDSPAYERLHIASYSLIDNPFDGRHQNCTTFLLDLVGAAAWDTTDPAQIEANLRAWFKPTVVHADILQRTFGPMIDPRISTDDQHGPLVTAGFESIAAFMRQNRLSAATYAFKRPAFDQKPA